MTRQTLWPHQVELQGGIRGEWARGIQRVAGVLPTGGGKGHPLDTEVPTPDGWRRWGDLTAGDFVFGSDGRPTQVTQVFDRGVLRTYRVTFTDGASVDVDGDHLWQVGDATRRRTSRFWRVLSTRALAATDLRMARGYRFRVPMADAVGRPEVNLPLDPYVVGALIANGCLTGNGTQLTTPDLAVAARVGAAVAARRVVDSTPGVCPRWLLSGVTQATRDLGLRVPSGEKRVPSPYLAASVGQRLALLHGLMDGDGARRDDTRRSVEYSTTSAGLARDVVELVTSLGGTANSRVAVRDGKTDEWVLGVMLPSGMPAFGTERKSGEGSRAQVARVPVRSIVSIEVVEPREIRCVTVDASDSLYLITRDHIVTHNTTTFVDTAEGWLAGNPGRRCVVIAHRTELIEQAAARVKLHTDLSVGIVKAERNQTRAPIVVASVQSLASSGGRRARQIADVGLVIVDECHRAAARSYVDALTTFGCYREGGALALGVTATLSRSDRLSLGAVWQSVVEGPTIMDGVRDGWLVRPHGLLVRVEDLSFRNVRMAAGDYRVGDLGDALVDSLAPTRIAEAYREHAADRQGIVFTPTVAAAEVVCAALVTAGFTAEMVHGGTPAAERAAIVQRYRDGGCQILVNCMVFTEGTDLPATSCIVVARPTKSNGLYVQMVGRGLRTSPGKSDCLVLDVCGASRRNRLQAQVDLFGPEDPLTQEDAPERPEVDDELENEPLDDDDPIVLATPGDLVVEVVDLFAGSNAGWMRTRAGVWFIPTRDRYLAVLPGMTPDGGFDVWSVPKDVTVMWDVVRYGVVDLVGARTMAEAQVTSREKIRRDRGGFWSPGVSVPQMRLAGRLGIGVAPGMTQGEVSALIDGELATRRIDPWLPATMFDRSSVVG